jgi:tetratricopeptide (TPR) repeat protein
MTAPETMTTNCPDEETLAAFSDGVLNAADGRRVMQHMSVCADCRSMVLAMSEMRTMSETTPAGDGAAVSRFALHGMFRAAAVLAAAAALIIIFGPMAWQRWTAHREMGTLVAAAADLDVRTVEGWLTGGFEYKPYRGPTRSAGDETPPEQYLLEYAARGVIATAASSQSVDKLHGAGIAHLLVGERDAAIRTLEEAVRKSAGIDNLSAAIEKTTDAELLNDLSVAYFARGRSAEHAADFTASLNAAERAWQLKQTPAIAWNRALAVSQLHLQKGAEGAWDDFLGIATDPDWRKEAEARRASLSTATSIEEWRDLETRLAGWLRQGRAGDIAEAVRRFPAQARQYFDTVVVTEWARMQNGGKDTHQSPLLGLSLAQALALAGEELPLDAMAAIDRACATSRCGLAVEAHLRHASARRLIEKREYGRASSELERVERDFAAFGSPYAFVARFERLTCLIYRNDYENAIRGGHELLSDARHGRYRTLQARTLWLIGLCELQALHPEEALQRYRDAERLFESGRDDAFLAAIRVRIADALEFVGDADAASQYRFRALAGMHRSGDYNDYGLTVYEAGAAALSRGRANAADTFFGEAIRFARETRRPDLGAMAALWRATRLSRAGDFAGVVQQTRVAEEFWRAVVDSDVKQRVEASAGAILGPARLSERPERQLTSAIAFFERTDARTWLPALFHQRAMMAKEEGDRVSAERDLRKAIEIAEDVLGTGAAASIRDGFTADVRESYAELIALLLESDREEDALEIAERSRLIGRPAGANRVPLSELAVALPPSMNIALYEMQSDGLIVWLVRQGRVQAFRSPATRGELQRLAGGWSGQGPSPRALAELYDVLMRPYAGAIVAPGELVIVPAPGLESVPYSALYDRFRGRHVADDLVVSATTSLTELVQSSGKQPASEGDRLLLLADAAYRHMDRLPASRSEAMQVSKLYRNATTIVGEDATGPRLLAELERATALHFAGHATVNEVAPEMSALIVAGAGGEDDGRVYVHELSKRTFPLRLVVLSACSTARTRAGDARGSVTVARAFLDGGAGAVVGTLWPVADADAAMFSVRFHQSLRAGATPAAAVRLAQLHMRSRGAPGAAWGAFCIMQRAS